MVSETGESDEVIRLTGELDAASVLALRSSIERRLAVGEPRLHFDLSGLDFIDSRGFALLLGLHRRMRLTGGHMEITGVSESIRRVFQLTGLAWLLEPMETFGSGE